MMSILQLPTIRSPWVAAAAAAGTLAVAWCVYFDHKRRSAPGFRKKLKEKRARQSGHGRSGVNKSGASNLPDMNNYEAVQKFFIQELQLGEELLAQNEVESAVEHLSNAIAVCGQPQQLLAVLQQTLPQPVFHAVLQNLPIVSQRLSATLARSDSAAKSTRVPAGISLEEDDVE